MAKHRDERILVRFGSAVRAKRTALGLTQERLAERAELHVTYISGIEGGRRNPSLTIVAAVARALGCPIGELAD